MSESKPVYEPEHVGHEVSPETHRWNFWTCSSEAALFMTGTRIMGPMTLIPFLFKQIGLDDAWLALFTISFIVMALGNPIGTALAGGRRWKLPFCMRLGVIQRVPFLMVPLGAMFFYSGPKTLLLLLVLAFVLSNFSLGLTQPVFQVVITNGIHERYWARMMSMRSILAAIGGLGAAAFVWWVNETTTAPTNYVILGWTGVVLLFMSLAVVSRIREVPMDRELPHGWAYLSDTFSHMGSILRDDPRVRWIVLGRIFRSFGFVVGTYMTSVFIDRCALTDEQMYLPILMMTASQIVAYALAGWLVDRFGPKPALVLSSLCIALNSVLIMRADTLGAFAVVFAVGIFGGGLLMSGWTPLILKLAPIEHRPAYTSVTFLTSAPATTAALLIGMLLVRFTGYDYVFYLSAFGGICATIIFLWKIPHIRYAPTR
ncbi:MAG: MFS transporter [Nitrospiraceae bacterium]|nr:MFS transporter [Nitrospiraceae bacterium]